jgi:enolase
MVEFYKDLAQRFPIISIEDPFAQTDWEGFRELNSQLPISNFQTLIGDDLTTTNIKKIKEAESKKACNGIIIKLNQIGTVWETLEAVKLAQSYGWKIMVSHRSGETMDNFIADFAVGVGADFIKSGAYTKPERIVKYDRLLEIEQALNKK